MWIDTLITIVILGGLVLAVWAAVSKQTVAEVIRDIWEFVGGKLNREVPAVD
jgi:Flp pilus assembly pilin Flp